MLSANRLFGEGGHKSVGCILILKKKGFRMRFHRRSFAAIVNKGAFDYIRGHFLDTNGEPRIRQLHESFSSRTLIFATSKVRRSRLPSNYCLIFISNLSFCRAILFSMPLITTFCVFLKLVWSIIGQDCWLNGTTHFQQ